MLGLDQSCQKNARACGLAKNDAADGCAASVREGDMHGEADAPLTAPSRRNPS